MPIDNQIPSSTGVRIAGDHYQWLHVWSACMEALYDDVTASSSNPIEAVGVEISGAGNVDDVVRYRQRPPHVYAQVKYAVDHRIAVGLEYLDSEGILRKMVAAHAKLTADGTPVELRLITNRTNDPQDLMMQQREGRDGRLLPRGGIGGDGSALGKVRADWASAARVDVATLLRFFADFHLDVAYELWSLTNDVGRLMTANGLKSDEAAIERGASWVAAEVRAGHRRMTLGDIRAAVTAMNLQAGSPWTTVSIATIAHDQLADQAAVSIDWVDRIAGDKPRLRVAPKHPHTWEELAADLATVPGRLGGSRRVLLGGHFRQATGFFLGAQCQWVQGFQVAVRQGDQIWGSEEMTADYPMTITENHPNRGGDAALIVNVSFDASQDVSHWIERSALPIGTVVIATPAAGVGPTSVPNPVAANSLAVSIRDLARRSQADALHLFLVGPLGVAVLMGHHWNRVATTYVYEHLGSDDYARAFTVDV